MKDEQPQSGPPPRGGRPRKQVNSQDLFPPGAGLIDVEKGFRGRVPKTTLRLTPNGRAAIDRHWARLEDLRAAAAAWRPRLAEEG